MQCFSGYQAVASKWCFIWIPILLYQSHGEADRACNISAKVQLKEPRVRKSETGLYKPHIQQAVGLEEGPDFRIRNPVSFIAEGHFLD